MPKKQINKNNLKASLCQSAFTLAETLITLGIIGIVAALTLPNLIMQYQKDQTISQLKETYTILNNALENAKVEYGTDINDWPMKNDGTSATASTYFAKYYLLPYLKTINICGTNTSNECKHKVGYISNLTSATKNYYDLSGDSAKYAFTLANGALVSIKFDGFSDTIRNCQVIVRFDINGIKPPNIIGKDAFEVELGGGSDGDRNKFIPYGILWFTVRQKLFDVSQSDLNACDKNSGMGWYCFGLIVQDGWKIADDYPW